MSKNEAIRKAKNFDEILDIQYGKVGTELRNKFEEKAQYFVISELLKDARREANMTQEELATKIGTNLLPLQRKSKVFSRKSKGFFILYSFRILQICCYYNPGWNIRTNKPYACKT